MTRVNSDRRKIEVKELKAYLSARQKKNTTPYWYVLSRLLRAASVYPATAAVTALASAPNDINPADNVFARKYPRSLYGVSCTAGSLTSFKALLLLGSLSLRPHRRYETLSPPCPCGLRRRTHPGNFLYFPPLTCTIPPSRSLSTHPLLSLPLPPLPHPSPFPPPTHAGKQ